MNESIRSFGSGTGNDLKLEREDTKRSFAPYIAPESSSVGSSTLVESVQERIFGKWGPWQSFLPEVQLLRRRRHFSGVLKKKFWIDLRGGNPPRMETFLHRA
jgi:hypothetical protein